MKLEDLKKPFPADLISWRVGATNKKKRENDPTLPLKGIALAYIDARDVMQKLDDVCGIGGWQALHPHANGKTSCRIGIKIGDEWIWKENGAGDSDESAEKGAFSDSFKRAAVLWGVGRYLYDVANVWVELDEWGKIKNEKDPKLTKALKDAESGIRSKPEPEPEVKSFTDEEANLLIDRITKSANAADFEEEKLKARAAWPRMSKTQQTLITGKIEKRSKELVQAPLAAE